MGSSMMVCDETLKDAPEHERASARCPWAPGDTLWTERPLRALPRSDALTICSAETAQVGPRMLGVPRPPTMRTIVSGARHAGRYRSAAEARPEVLKNH